jgi:hypothetical protein
VTEGFKSNPTGLSYKDEKMFKLEKLPITLITFLLCLYDFFRPEYHRYIDNWVTVYQIIAWVLGLILVVFLIMLKSTLADKECRGALSKLKKSWKKKNKVLDKIEDAYCLAFCLFAGVFMGDFSLFVAQSFLLVTMHYLSRCVKEFREDTNEGQSESPSEESMSRDDTFMSWFVDYIHNATLDDLKKEPIGWEDRMAYLQKKFEGEK